MAIAAPAQALSLFDAAQWSFWLQLRADHLTHHPGDTDRPLHPHGAQYALDSGDRVAAGRRTDRLRDLRAAAVAVSRTRHAARPAGYAQGARSDRGATTLRDRGATYRRRCEPPALRRCLGAARPRGRGDRGLSTGAQRDLCIRPQSDVWTRPRTIRKRSCERGPRDARGAQCPQSGLSFSGCPPAVRPRARGRRQPRARAERVCRGRALLCRGRGTAALCAAPAHRGKRDEAKRVLKELLEHARLAPRYYRRMQREWLVLAERELSALP